MKLIHLSDLHLGKKVNEFSMLEDQQYILTKIINIIDEEKPQGVIIAGDVYDKTIPPTEAVELFDDFLYRLSKRNLQVFIISGNHDSAERIAFGSRLMDQSGIHMSPVYNGIVKPITMQDENGEVCIYMLPFLKPINVKRFYNDEAVETYTDAIRTAISHMDIDNAKRNILVTHQFVTGALRSDSETVSVGGTDNVDASVFEAFDYVALGHIHGPQSIGKETVRYCGTPLKYSFSEVGHKKSVTVVELSEKENVVIRTVPLEPLRDMREIKGKYEEILLKENYEGTNLQNYMHITLTDEEEIINAMSNLRVIYPNLMKIDYDNKRTRNNQSVGTAEDVERKSPLELFSEFYLLQNNQPMNEKQTEFMHNLIEKIWEGEQ